MKKVINFNENNYLAEIQLISLGCEKLNELKSKIEDFTGSKVNKSELSLSGLKSIDTLINNPEDLIRNYVNESTPEDFKNANFDFKLEALGLKNSYNEIIDFITENKSKWISYKYHLNKGVFEFKDFEDIKQKHTMYAESETELTKLDYFNKLKDLLNNGFESGFLNINARPDMIRTIRELNIDVPKGESDFKVVVNPYTIKDVE